MKWVTWAWVNYWNLTLQLETGVNHLNLSDEWNTGTWAAVRAWMVLLDKSCCVKTKVWISQEAELVEWANGHWIGTNHTLSC